jgi:hypothetical protein
VIVPSWAIWLIAGLLGVLLAAVRWGAARFTATVDSRLEKVEGAVGDVKDAVGGVDRRLIVVETILNDGGGSAPASPRIRVLTPPQGVPPPRT